MTTEGSPVSHPPTDYEQALERANDDLTLTELTNMLYSLPSVAVVQPIGDENHWDDLLLDVMFNDDFGRGIEDVVEILHRQGWLLDEAVFSRRKLRFAECDGDE